jgi:hypothetical protein
MLSPSEFAKELGLGIDERTVRRWAEKKVLPAEDTATGHHRISALLVPALQQLAKDGVALNARTLRGRFEQSPQEDRPPT